MKGANLRVVRSLPTIVYPSDSAREVVSVAILDIIY